MKSNKKDVNDYFKYLRLYYVELLKKQKKEEQKNKRKKVIIDNIDEDDDDDINVFEKDTTNRKKIIRSTKLNAKKKNIHGIDESIENKQPDRTKITKKIEDEIIKRKEKEQKKKQKEEEIEIIRRQHEQEFEELKQEQEKNIEEERIKREEDKKEHIYEDVREKLKKNGIDENELDNIENINELDIDSLEYEIDKIINDIENYRNPRIGRQIASAGNEEEKENKEDKKEELEVKVPIVEEEVEEIELEDPELNEDLEEEIILEEKIPLEEEIKEELDEPTLEEEIIKEELEEPALEEKIIEEELDEPVLEEEIIEEELDEPTLEEEIYEEELEEPVLEEEIVEEELDETTLEEEIIEEELEEPALEEEIIEEEMRKIGQEEFIKTVNKKISDDYKSLHNLEMENHRLTQELENARDVGDVDKLLERIQENQNQIDSIIGRIQGIENGEIISEVYEFSKTKPKELKEFIKELESEPNNYRYIDELYKPYFKDNIDYKERVTRLKNDTNAKEEEIQNTRDTFSNLDDKRNDNDVELDRYNKKRLHFENKLLKFQVAISTLQSKVQNITVQEKKITRFFLGNIEIKSKMDLKRIAINMFNQPGNEKDFREIYQELQSRLTIVENSKLVPSDNYRNTLLNEKNNLFNTRLELGTTISEIRAMKEEFKEEFSDYYDNDEYFSYLEQIEKMERKFVSQTDKITLLDTKIDQTILENDKKVAEIEQMNIGRDNVRVIQDPNNIQQQYYQQQQNPYYQGYNPYDNGEYQQDYEQERSRGRGR